LGVAVGLTFALCLAVTAWVAACCGWGSAMVERYATMFYGYDATFIGGLWGALWGFIKGFILGFLIMFFYCMIKRCCAKSCQCTCHSGNNGMQKK
jgi:hypothetical protein